MWNNHEQDPRNYIGQQIIDSNLATKVITVETQSLEEKKQGKLVKIVRFVSGVTLER